MLEVGELVDSKQEATHLISSANLATAPAVLLTLSETHSICPGVSSVARKVRLISGFIKGGEGRLIFDGY